MKIAIQAADLDAPRIDGTRVYIKQCLKYFGKLDDSSEFLIYHKNKFNPELTPPNFSNYQVVAKPKKYFWTQTFFAWSVRREKPDILWMPMHNIPIFRKRGMKTVVTIHDLAFKYFPETFTAKDLFKINLLTKIAIMFADKIITISESSKRDILKFYPGVKEEDVKVIYHGFDAEVFQRERDVDKEEEIKKKYKIVGNYIIYIGAIQPRKNLEKLVEAFEILKSQYCHAELVSASPKGSSEILKQVQDDKVPEDIKNLKLVLIGEHAWLSESVFKKIKNSPYKNDIITPGRINFEPLGHLLRGSRAFVFPSLYEGFGIPILEAFASRVPVICSKNSSLPEVGGDAAIYFSDNDASDMAEKIESVITDENLRASHIAKGLEQIKKFSWEKCARETLKYLKS